MPVYSYGQVRLPAPYEALCGGIVLIGRNKRMKSSGLSCSIWRFTAISMVAALALVFSLAVAIVPTMPAEAHPGTIQVDINDPGCVASPQGDPYSVVYCDIQDAIDDADADDTIIIAPGTYDEHDITINKSLTIQGAGAGVTSVDGQNISCVFLINVTYTVDMSGLTIQNGNMSAAIGGGIINAGDLILTDCTVSGNTANVSGGGIYNAGNVTMTNCTISGNTASATATNGSAAVAIGGGIGILGGNGTVTLTNCTMSGNTASATATSKDELAIGGGIGNLGGNVTVTLTNCTISGNTATSGSAAVAIGGGIYIAAESDVTMTCTIVYGNIADTDSNIYGTYADIGGESIVGDPDPLLGPLQDNGGPTETHALLTGSPAIDACTTDCPPPATDQRGQPRPADGDIDGTYFCDVGAYERQVAVGGIVEPVDRLQILMPWLGLAALMALALAVVVIMKRRRLA